MRVIVAGSRNITDYHLVTKAIVESGFMYEIAQVVCGGAPGVDLLGDQFAAEVGLPVEYYLVTDDGKYDYFKLKNLRLGNGFYIHDDHRAYANVAVVSDWKRDGKAAGPIRNRAMAEYADALILVWDGSSRGSGNMLGEARRHDLRVFERTVEVE